MAHGYLGSGLEEAERERLRATWQRSDSERHGRLQADIVPRLIRQLAVSAALRNGVPFDRASQQAREDAPAIIAAAEARPDPASARSRARPNADIAIRPDDPVQSQGRSSGEPAQELPRNAPDGLARILREINDPASWRRMLDKPRDGPPSIAPGRKGADDDAFRPLPKQGGPGFLDRDGAFESLYWRYAWPLVEPLMRLRQQSEPARFIAPNQGAPFTPLTEEERRQLNNPDLDEMRRTFQKLHEMSREREAHRGLYPVDDFRLPLRERGFLEKRLEELFQHLPRPPVKQNEPLKPPYASRARN